MEMDNKPSNEVTETGPHWAEKPTEEERFDALKLMAKGDQRGVWDVYTNGAGTSLIYRPISSLSFQELVGGRERLADDGLVLIGIEVSREEIFPHDPDNHRRKGCFKVSEWLTPDFQPAKKPEHFKKIKRSLEKESGWLRGGPR